MILGLIGVLACNQAPADYRDRTLCVNPSDALCDRRVADGDVAVEASGLLLCGIDHEIVPVDDPILEACTAAPPGLDTPMWTIYDGQQARAYTIAKLIGRELVHDELSAEAVVVDY